MKRRVVITGVGLIGAGGMSVSEFWSNLEKGKSSIEKITKCNTSRLNVKYGGQIKDQLPAGKFNSRFISKCDDFSIYSLYAVDEALKDAKLNTKDIDKDRIGVYVGNSSGGWHGAEIGLNSLHNEGVEAVSPYLASNWFPAAPQGHITIYFGLKGYSKTVIGDMAGSNIAIGNAFRIIQNGKADYMIAGGSENLMVAWALMFYQTNGILSYEDTDPELVYQPFGEKRSGLVLSEGAAFVVLESLESAKARNADIYCEVAGYGLTNDGYDYIAGSSDGEQYARCVRIAVKDSIPDLVFLNGAAHEREDNSEVNGVNTAFKKEIEKVRFTCPKAFYGHCYGASSSMDVITACYSMKHNRIIKTGNVVNLADNINFNMVTKENISSRVDTALIIAKGLGGINSGIFLNKNVY